MTTPKERIFNNLLRERRLHLLKTGHESDRVYIGKEDFEKLKEDLKHMLKYRGKERPNSIGGMRIYVVDEERHLFVT